MFSFQQEFDVPADRKLVIVLPPEAEVGQRVAVAVTSQSHPAKKPRTSLSQFFKENGEDWGDQIKSTDVEGFTGRKF